MIKSNQEQPIWEPTPRQIEEANLTHFIAYINEHYKMTLTNYESLHRWSLKNMRDFWRAIWDFCKVLSPDKGKQEIKLPHGIFKPQFLPDAKLNFAENLLRPRPDKTPSLIFWGEDKVKRTLSYKETYEQVGQLAAYLRSIGVEKGDRIAAYVPNTPEAVIAMLATASIGAIWSSCSPDFGASGVLDRFGQIEPKVLFMADGYYYKGKWFSCLDRIAPLYEGLPSLEKIVVFPYGDQLLPPQSESYVLSWEEALAPFESLSEIEFIPLPFHHPAFILYSSGTTGKPKCIVHSVGGTLLQHLKEHQLHCDLKPGDRVFYFTTCGWMMWNWQVSALASGATLVLYDGCPAGDILWKYAEVAKVTLFGTSAKFIDATKKEGLCPKEVFDLSSLRMITSTGSPLAPESYDFAYEHISSKICLASISGGTDIISCFALGNPIGPVWRGELQVPGLGMDVQIFNEKGQPIVEEKGELVCTNAFPSMPNGFWKDPGDKKYFDAYFAKFPNVWCHGDFAERTKHGGFIIYGRSDTVLNPGGVRIGTAEIYRIVEQFPGVLESVVVGQNWEDDVRVILFVKLKEGVSLTPELIDAVKTKIRHEASPRHVPAKIIQVPDIPKTKSGKIVEKAVQDVIHGKKINNLEALANPGSLKYFVNI